MLKIKKVLNNRDRHNTRFTFTVDIDASQSILLQEEAILNAFNRVKVFRYRKDTMYMHIIHIILPAGKDQKSDQSSN